MLFFLDNNIDVAVRAVINSAGHQCVTARDVGMSDADDEAISIWGHEHKAVVVTHDRSMIRLRRDNSFGLHVWLDCADTDAVEVMAKQLPEIATMLQGKDSVILEVTRTKVTYRAGQWH